MKKQPKLAKGFWIVLGSICLVLGSIGIVLPILPTVPFYLATLFCYAKGSERLHDWFIHTNLYHKHLESFVRHEGMTVRTKLTIMITVTIVMGLGFFFMKRVPVARMILVIVWIAHVIAFVFFVKTKQEDPADEADAGSEQTNRAVEDQADIVQKDPADEADDGQEQETARRQQEADGDD